MAKTTAPARSPPTKPPPSKRIKTEVKDDPDPSSEMTLSDKCAEDDIRKFDIGTKVYKSNLPSPVKTTRFEVTNARLDDGGQWLYTIKNKDFMGEGSTMTVPESQIFTVEHPLKTTFKFPVHGTAKVTHAVGAITDWNFVHGQVVYDLTFDKKIARHDLP
ncbi:uncharacterized protein AB675_4724 [Cyphellophora attinorum]|uniref:Uncharacterized protein n=1 Tax=Cyphellophora attinorum TaxID=1664694 RepID=A0A0N1HSH5_9EURO|nr:uncharacterized protein AB675_4724 [Phialophora attinorum]KPI39132.1 hypothetical protein AB675_4724 [Phialophora attinorum]